MYSFHINATLDVAIMRTDERNKFDDDEASKEMKELFTESRTMRDGESSFIFAISIF